MFILIGEFPGIGHIVFSFTLRERMRLNRTLVLRSGRDALLFRPLRLLSVRWNRFFPVRVIFGMETPRLARTV